MLSVSPGRRIWLYTAPTDMRRSFDGLSAMVRNHLGENPTSGQWFVFVNRRRTQLKVLAFEEGGFCIWAKRLERGQFAQLSSNEDKRLLCQTELLALIEGVDMTIKRQRKRYKMAA